MFEQLVLFITSGDFSTKVPYSHFKVTNGCKSIFSTVWAKQRYSCLQGLHNLYSFDPENICYDEEHWDDGITHHELAIRQTVNIWSARAKEDVEQHHLLSAKEPWKEDTSTLSAPVTQIGGTNKHAQRERETVTTYAYWRRERDEGTKVEIRVCG